ncbi:vomeronasal type-1 receptor 4-like [Cricetulus griseus]|uniref:Vomeronasal type-1 receptor n=1 Tax=Cricetulus griseus TaxID=10029 RepID=A0A061HZ32_CRIGR|nr:vomeronasal type-1 receptor 4-like [Cricetulus griseus]ERE62707.1 vomeronasal type-1 receptor [Cricetulus griseus]
MDFWNLATRVIFLSQITTGIMGNFSLIFYYLVLYYRESTLKPTDLILLNLMAANALIILSAGVPQTMAVWGLKKFLNDFGCKILLYIQGFSRSLSICTTCLLSVFQVMTINPRKSCCKGHKVRTVKYIGCSLSLLWVLYMLINFIFVMYPFTKINSKNVTRKRDFGYCSIVGHDEISDSLYGTLAMCPEFFFSLLIAWSSASMIVTLYRHRQRVQYICSSHSSSRKFPEYRATQNILFLVSTFLAFYTVSTVLRSCIAFLYNHNWWLVDITHLTSLCFPSFGPFILKSHYSIVSRFTLAWIRKKLSPYFIISM